MWLISYDGFRNLLVTISCHLAIVTIGLNWHQRKIGDYQRCVQGDGEGERQN